MDADDVFDFYRDEFLFAYSDLVSFIVKKPKQILTEIENTFSHMAQYFNSSLDEDEKQENLKKAYGHLVRVTIDCYKLLWVKLKEELELIYLDEKKRVFALNIPEEEFLKKYQQFRAKAKDARTLEIKNIGTNPFVAIEAYKETILIGHELLKSVDGNKLNKLHIFKTIITTKECIITLILGIISGFIAGKLI